MRRFALLFCLLWPTIASGQALDVAVTLKPIHSLTARLMSGIGEPKLIVRGSLSPHRFTLRPSETRTLHQADLVIWIGSTVEPGLTKTLQTLGPKTQILTVGDAPALNLLQARESGAWAQTTRDNVDHGHSSGHIDHKDPHFWLDPVRATTAAQLIAEALIANDPSHRTTYQANLATLVADLNALNLELLQRFKPLESKPLFVFHDAYQYLESRYQLRVVGALTVSADRTPGARRVSQIRAQIQQAGATCVLREPQFKPALIRVLVEGTSARSGTIDPLGSSIPAGPGHYFSMMRRSASSIESCLTD